MSHVRCFAHALVTAVALVSWAGVAWMGLYHGSAADPLRMFGMALIGVASVTTGIALLPVVFVSYLKRYTDLVDHKTYGEAMWNMGCAHGRNQERRKQEITRAGRLHAVQSR